MVTKRRVVVEVNVPEGFEQLDEKTLAGIARAAIEKRLFLLKRLEELVPEPLASEEEIVEMDRTVKRTLARRLENELSEVRGRH